MSKYVRERLGRSGPQALTTPELLSLFFKGRPLSPSDLEQVSTLLTQGLQLLQSDWSEVGTKYHLSPTRCAQLQAVLELARRLQTPALDKYRIRSPGDAAKLLMAEMAYLDHEEMHILILDAKNQVVENINRYKGTVNSSVLRVAEIFRPAITRNCPGVIVCHNHPSGDPTPSPEDIKVTEQLAAAGRVLDIDLVDHIIIGNQRYVSLKEQLRW